MKQCHRFHIEDVEVGDRFRFTNSYLSEERLEEDELPIDSFEAVVRRAYRTHNFGWVFEVVPDGSVKSLTLYLDDGWDFDFIPSPHSN